MLKHVDTKTGISSFFYIGDKDQHGHPTEHERN